MCKIKFGQTIYVFSSECSATNGSFRLTFFLFFTIHCDYQGCSQLCSRQVFEVVRLLRLTHHDVNLYELENEPYCLPLCLDMLV